MTNAEVVGFDEDFIGVSTPPPAPGEGVGDDLLVVAGRARIDYTHFSLVMSRSRRLARWVAWNIDGSSLHSGIDRVPFRADPRLPEGAQVLNETYEFNDLDRGHLARRKDLLWGPRAVAEQANADSFYFTNIAPQMEDFNQSDRNGVWGRLEDALLEFGGLDQKRVNIMAGPVLRPEDRSFRDVQIPHEFWKLTIYRVDGQARFRAFVLTQDLTGLEAAEYDLKEFETYEVDLQELERRTGLQFGATTAAASGKRREIVSLEQIEPIKDVKDIDWASAT